jgi:hypothetical protein
LSELIKIQSGVEAVEPAQYDSGLDSVRIAPSFIKLVHPTTTKPEGMGTLFKPGDWIDSDSAEVVNNHVFVPIAIQKGRTYFPPGQTNSKFLCKSLDGITPASFVETPMNDRCDTCQYSKWQNNNGKFIPPPCSEQQTLLCIDKTTGLPVKIQFSKTSLNTVKDFLALLRKKAITLKSQGVARPDMYYFTFTLSSVKAKTSANYVPIITFAGLNDKPEDYAGMLAMLSRAARETEEVVNESIPDSEVIDVEEV